MNGAPAWRFRTRLTGVAIIANLPLAALVAVGALQPLVAFGVSSVLGVGALAARDAAGRRRDGADPLPERADADRA